jgi:DNA (cytosine-5)-methyltransferase 1
LEILDLFSGCGGLSSGLAKAGCDVAWANEIDNDAAQSFSTIHPNTKMFNEDIKVFISRVLEGDAQCPSPGKVDVIVGGPPCQGFSGYNRFRELNDERNSLVFDFIKLVDILKPKGVLIENVPGMLNLEKGVVCKRILESLQELSFYTELGIMQGGHFGIPQNRWRLFIFAHREKSKKFSFPTGSYAFPKTTVFGAKDFKSAIIKPHGKISDLFNPLLPHATVREAISDLPSFNNGELSADVYKFDPSCTYQKLLRGNSIKVSNHLSPKLGSLNIRRIRNLPKKDGVGWSDLPEELQPRNLKKYGPKDFNNRFGRLSWDGIFNTIVTKIEPYWGRVIHPEDERVLSVRECARAQSFSDDCVFHGGITSCTRQIGNAVPPLLAEAIGVEIINFFKE